MDIIGNLRGENVVARFALADFVLGYEFFVDIFRVSVLQGT